MKGWREGERDCCNARSLEAFSTEHARGIHTGTSAVQHNIIACFFGSGQ